MSVLFAQVSTTGLVPNTSGNGIGMTQQSPEIIYLNTNDTLATVLTAGYLNAAVNHFQLALNNFQMALVYTTDDGCVWLRVLVTFSGATATYSLESTPVESGVAVPTVANQITYSTDTIGSLASLGLATALFNAGNISAGKSGTAGSLFSFPSVAANGKLGLTAVANAGNFTTTISSVTALGQAEVITIPDAGASTANFILSKTTGTQHITVGALQVDAGTITSGFATGPTAGGFIAYPATTTTGSLRLTPVGNVGNFASTISDVTGLAQASVYTLPDPGAATARFLVAATATPFTTGHLPASSGTGGLMVDSGIVATNVQLKTQVKAVLTGNIGGAGAGPLTVTVAGMTATSVVVATVSSSSNPCYVLTATPGTGNFALTVSADPGASLIVNYIAYIAAQ